MTEAKVAKKPAKKATKKVVSKSAPKTKKPAKKVEDSKAKFAVFATGGKQYRVSVGNKVKIEKIKGEYQEGDKITFDNVLLVDDGKEEVSVGTPFIKGSVVNATIYKIARQKKIEVVKYKAKSRYFKRYGHRQPYFEIVIDSIK